MNYKLNDSDRAKSIKHCAIKLNKREFINNASKCFLMSEKMCPHSFILFWLKLRIIYKIERETRMMTNFAIFFFYSNHVINKTNKT